MVFPCNHGLLVIQPHIFCDQPAFVFCNFWATVAFLWEAQLIAVAALNTANEAIWPLPILNSRVASVMGRVRKISGEDVMTRMSSLHGGIRVSTCTATSSLMCSGAI